jgi:hypothetical protein
MKRLSQFNPPRLTASSPLYRQSGENAAVQSLQPRFRKARRFPRKHVVIANAGFEGEMTESRLFVRKH